jgi:hypothetical protein
MIVLVAGFHRRKTESYTLPFLGMVQTYFRYLR